MPFWVSELSIRAHHECPFLFQPSYEKQVQHPLRSQTPLLCFEPICLLRTLDTEGSRILHTRAAEAYQSPTVLVLDSFQDEFVLEALLLYSVPQGSRLHLALRLITLELLSIQEPRALDDGGQIKGEDGIFPIIHLHIFQA